MLIYYYEQIAADITRTTPEKFMVRARYQKDVLARQFCMVYRCNVLKMSEKESAKRYGLNHSTAHHAKTDLNDYQKNRDVRYKRFVLFLSQCKDYKFKNGDKEDYVDLEKTVHNKISNSGFREYINKTHDNFSKLILSINNDEEERQILYQIEICHQNIHELMLLYEQ